MHPSTPTFIRPAAAFIGFAALGGVFSLGTIVAQQPMPPTKVTALMTQVLADFPGHEVIMSTLDIPPGGGSQPHRHPGHHIFGYVLDGAYKIKLDGGSERTLTKGDTFYEAPGQLHAVSRNASDTAPARVLIVAIAQSGTPLTVPERP